MLAILFSIVLGGMSYKVSTSCSDLGGTYFPPDDSKATRVLSICTEYKGQTRQIVEHELLHICMHQHLHRYSTQQELAQHLNVQLYKEEYFATEVAPCLIANRAKLYTALRKHNVDFY